MFSEILNFTAFIGKFFLNLFRTIGGWVEYVVLAILKIVLPPYYFKQFTVQCMEIGYFSLPVVALTAIFSGMVLALQAYSALITMPSESIIANIVAISLTRELAPVLTSLMIAGRVSSAISAEIGTMKVTEQLDALQILSINPLKFLVAPKIVAGIICVPLLVLVADLLGIMGGYLVAITKLNFNGVNYLTSTYQFLTFYDVFSGVVKGICFGFILTTFGCYFGYRAINGAQGVGKSTTHAVVASSIAIFLLDYVLTVIFFGVR